MQGASKYFYNDDGLSFKTSNFPLHDHLEVEKIPDFAR